MKTTFIEKECKNRRACKKWSGRRQLSAFFKPIFWLLSRPSLLKWSFSASRQLPSAFLSQLLNCSRTSLNPYQFCELLNVKVVFFIEKLPTFHLWCWHRIPNSRCSHLWHRENLVKSSQNVTHLAMLSIPRRQRFDLSRCHAIQHRENPVKRSQNVTHIMTLPTQCR